MQTYRPDWLVRVLSGMVSVVYYVAWVATVLGLAGIPAARLLPARYLGAYWHVEAPVTVDPAAPLVTGTRSQAVHAEISQVRARLSVPIAQVPTAVLLLEWVSQAAGAVLMLLFLYHLRRVFQRVKAGAPFDAANATHLRWMGFLLLALSVGSGVFEFWLSLALARVVEGGGNQLGTGLDLRLPLVFVALVLIVLGEVFRRGAALEDEQSLVV